MVGWPCYRDGSGGNLIADNELFANGNLGIFLQGDAATGDYNIIRENVMTGNDTGTAISFWWSAYNEVTDNSITSFYRGIDLGFSWQNQFIDNTISDNVRGGSAGRSSGNLFTGNTISNNSEHGLRLTEYSSSAKFYHNNFINNGTQVVRHMYFVNSWPILYEEYPTGGNYWSEHVSEDNFSGPDQDLPGSDGIGETHYGVSGEFCYIDCDYVVSYDSYPFMQETGWEAPPPPSEFWVEAEEDGACMVEEDANGDPDESDPLKCFPNGWILQRVTTQGNNPIEKEFDGIIWWKVIDVTDELTGWMEENSLNYNSDPTIQEEWKQKTEELKLGAEGTIPGILEAVNNYYDSTSTIPSLTSSNDDGNCLSMFKFQDFIFTRDLQKEDRNCDVRYLQIILRNEGPDIYPKGLVTGYFGTSTKAAVERFQQEYTIVDPPTGVVDSDTREQLNMILDSWPSEKSFPKELILAIIAQESRETAGRKGGEGGEPIYTEFNNELRTWDNGYGIMQITTASYKGEGSKLQVYQETCEEFRQRWVPKYQKWYPDYLCTWYTNTSQGIYANIKDRQVPQKLDTLSLS